MPAKTIEELLKEAGYKTVVVQGSRIIASPGNLRDKAARDWPARKALKGHAILEMREHGGDLIIDLAEF